MTVTYSAEVATSRGFGCFWKLLFRWRGSIYKLLWPDLCLYLFLYYFLSVIYRFALSDIQRRYFEKVSLYCKAYGDLIPVSFILGFYVSIVLKRWWDYFNCMPWPDTLAFFVSAYIHGQDDRGRLMRRSIMRYVNLAFVITLSCISPCVKKRFPTIDHLVDAGILLPNEKKIMEQLQTTHSKYWMPLVWASSIAIRARKEGRIRDDFALNTLVEAIAQYRSLCGGLYNYDWVSIPLVYTQVVTLVVYTFFLSALMGRQYLDPEQEYPGYNVDLYIPLFNFLQFFFYMGWLKVAETLVNPFGEDDDDFEVNWVIDRDIQVSYLIVDEMHQEHPELIKDQYWDEILPDLPYTAASMPFYTEPHMGSAANLVIPPHEAEFVPMETLDENEDELNDVKVNRIPYDSVNSHRLSHLSGSAYSGISRLGRSLHPSTYGSRGILNIMQGLLSRNPSVRKKKKSQVLSKNSTRDPSPSNTSEPMTPDDFKTHRGFSDDIFHLSDLSLADSRTGLASSPGNYSNMTPSEVFWGRRSERRPRSLQSQQSSISKASTPRGDFPDEDDESRSPMPRRKKSTTSLKQSFFKFGKFRESQKSLLDMALRNKHGSRRTLRKQNSEDVESINNEPTSPNEIVSLSPDSEDEVTVMEVNKPSKTMSKSSVHIAPQKSPNSTAAAAAVSNKPRSSLPHALDFSSTPTKDPGTPTLVRMNGSIEAAPKSAAEHPTPHLTSNPMEHFSFPPAAAAEDSQTKVSPDPRGSQTQMPPPAPKKVLHPQRATSLHIDLQKKGSEPRSQSGLQKFLGRYKNRHSLRRGSQPVSQPVSPAEEIQQPPTRGLFGQRGSVSPNLRRLQNSDMVTSSQSLVEPRSVKNLSYEK